MPRVGDLKWVHLDECTGTECYCADPTGPPDPMCKCRRPDWACVCAILDEEVLDASDD